MQINEAMKYAVSREQFLELMESEGYTVRWSASRKSITYTTPDGYRCRDLQATRLEISERSDGR